MNHLLKMICLRVHFKAANHSFLTYRGQRYYNPYCFDVGGEWAVLRRWGSMDRSTPPLKRLNIKCPKFLLKKIICITKFFLFINNNRNVALVWESCFISFWDLLWTLILYFETQLWPPDLSVCLLVELYGPFWILLRTILKILGTFWGPYWELFGNILGPFWDIFWVFIKVCYPIGTILGCVILGPFRDMFGTFYDTYFDFLGLHF